MLSTLLVALGGLGLGAALTHALAASFPRQLYLFFDSAWIVVPAILVAGLVLLGWRQLAQYATRRSGHPTGDLPRRDALTHLPLMLSLAFLLPWGINSSTPAQHWLWIGGAVTLHAALRARLAVALNLLPSKWADRALSFILFALPFALYLRTLTPGVGTKDGFELQVVSATLGIAHPTGYPLFTLLGRAVIALVPLGSPAYRINLMCAAFAALSIPLIYAAGRRVLNRRAPAAMAALIFAAIPAFWTQASIPEKYTLNALFVSLTLTLAVRWAQSPGESRRLWFYRLAFVYGLSLTHHRTMLLLAPALIVYGLVVDPKLLRRPKPLLAALGLFAAPLLLYAYIPWRAYAQGWQMTWPEFLAQISGSEYTPALRLDEWLTSPERRATYLRFLRGQFGAAGIGLGALGWLWLIRKHWRFALFSTVAWAAYVVFGIGYHAYYNDVNYFLPSHLIVALWIGAASDALFRGATWIARKVRQTPAVREMAFIGCGTLIALLPLTLAWTHLPEVDQSQADNGLAWGRHVLSLDLPANATILADSVKVAPLHYLTAIEKVRPDVKAVVLPDETAYVKSLEAHLAQGLPVYLARYLPNLGGAYYLRSLGPLVAVSLKPLADPPPLSLPQQIAFEGGIVLQGFDAPTLEAPRQGTLHVTLYWQPTEPIAESYQPRLRLVDGTGRAWWEEEGRLPVSDHYPTNAWRPGEVISDYHPVPLETTLQPGDYRLEVGLFRPFAGSGLPVTGQATDRASLGTVTVTSGWEGDPPQPGAARRARVAPKLLLLGLDIPEQVRPGGQIQLRLHWLTLDALPDYRPTLALAPASLPDATLTLPWPDAYDTAAWPPGSVVVTGHTARVPIGWPAGEVTVGLSLPAQGARADNLARFRVAGAPVTGQEAAVNFGDHMLLLDYEIPHKTLRPGDLFEMTAHWQGLADMDEDYTIFVHLLGPDGLSHGQVDVWPQDGTYPTSTWPVAETIADTYRVALDADAPPGPYRVEVGVYLLRTMGRLPVLNAGGHPIDDKLIIEGVNVE